MATRFDLVIDGSRLTPVSLKVFLEEFSAFFSEIEKEVTGEHSVELVVSALSYNSPATIGISARSKHRGRDNSRRVVRACSRAIRAVEAGSERPLEATDSALTHLQRMALQTNRHITALKMVVPSDRETSIITRATSQNVERLLRYEYSVGSIEGALEALSIHDEPRFTVYDAVSKVAVRCYFQPDDLDRVKDAVGAKVLVHGKLRRDREGKPQQIRPVRFFRRIDQSPREPQPSVAGAFAEMGDSRSYLELIRNE